MIQIKNVIDWDRIRSKIDTISDYTAWREDFMTREPSPAMYEAEQVMLRAIGVNESVRDILEELTFDAEPNMILKSGIAEALKELNSVYG